MAAPDDTTREAWRSSLIDIRARLDATQAQMAKKLGMSLRAYSDIETGVSKCRRVHILSAERISLTQAVQSGDLDLLAPSVRKEVGALAP